MIALSIDVQTSWMLCIFEIELYEIFSDLLFESKLKMITYLFA